MFKDLGVNEAHLLHWFYMFVDVESPALASDAVRFTSLACSQTADSAVALNPKPWNAGAGAGQRGRQQRGSAGVGP